MKPLAAAVALVFAAPLYAAQTAHPFDVHDLVMMDRVSDPALSPDGKLVAFQVRETDYDANKGKNGVWIVLGGLALGIPAALAAGRLLQTSWLIDPRDPVMLGAMLGILVAVALVASVVPAQRATRLEPIIALRTE